MDTTALPIRGAGFRLRPTVVLEPDTTEHALLARAHSLLGTRPAAPLRETHAEGLAHLRSIVKSADAGITYEALSDVDRLLAEAERLFAADLLKVRGSIADGWGNQEQHEAQAVQYLREIREAQTVVDVAMVMFAALDDIAYADPTDLA